MTPQDRIEAYCAAYEAANGHQVYWPISYDRGWFHFWAGTRVTNRYRASEINRMIERLHARAELAAPVGEEGMK